MIKGVRGAYELIRATHVVVVLLMLVTLLAATLLAASMVPSTVLAGRVLGATGGEGRAGAYTLDLIAHFGERARLMGACLLVITAGLAVLRRALEDLLATSARDVAAGIRWPTRTEVMVLGALLLVAVGLRFPFLGQPMRYDEALTFNEFASRPLYYALSFYPDPNNHLLNTLLVHIGYAALGNQPWVLRLPAFVAGALLAPATYALARLLYGWPAALLAGLLVATSSYVIEYSTNSRGYTLQALCFVVMLWLAVLAVRRDSPSALLLAVVVAALGAYAMPTMLLGVLVVAAWFGLAARGARVSRVGPLHVAASGLLLGLIVALSYLPVAIVSGPERLFSNRFVAPLEAAEFVSELPRSLTRTWAFWNRDVPLPIGALLVLGFTLATVAEARRGRVPLGVLASVVCLLMVVVQRLAPFERVWLFLLPLYLTIASGGLAAIAHGRLSNVVQGVGSLLGAGVLCLTVLTSGSIVASQETGAFADAEPIARMLGGRVNADDAVLTTVPASLPELQYYFPRSGLPIDVLVRAPRDAHQLFVIAPPGPPPDVPGWDRPERIQQFQNSALFQLKPAA